MDLAFMNGVLVILVFFNFFEEENIFFMKDHLTNVFILYLFWFSLSEIIVHPVSSCLEGKLKIIVPFRYCLRVLGFNNLNLLSIIQNPITTILFDCRS